MARERLDIEVRQRGARRVKREIQGIGSAAKTANKGIALLTAGIAGIAAIGVARQVIGLANSFQQLSNQVKVAVGEQGDLNGTLDELFNIADRTRAPVEAMVQLYQRGALAANELGASQQDLLNFTETVGTALAIQGGAAEQASGALLQLSQSLGSGIVRAEEFNSILEGAFPIAQAAARGIDEAGGSVAKLRTLIVEGKVTSDAFFRGILSQQEELAKVFATTAPTVDQAMTRIRNAFIEAAGSGNLSPLVDSLNDFADIIADPSFQASFGAFVSGIVKIASLGVEALGKVGELGQGLGIAIARFQGFEDADDGVAVLNASIASTKEEIEDITDALDGFSLKRGLLGDYNQEEDLAKLALLETRLQALTENRDILLKQGGDLGLGVGAASAGPAAPADPAPTPIDEKLVARQQAYLDGLRTQNDQLDIQARLGDNAAAALARYANEQEIIALQLTPAQAEAARELTEQIIAQNQAIDASRQQEAAQDFILSLEDQERALQLQAAEGDNAAAALRRYRIEQEAAKLGGDDFVQLALDIADGITAQEQALASLEAQRSDANFIADLEAEFELIGLSNRERFIEIQLRQLSAEATQDQRDAVAGLAAALFDENEKIKQAAFTMEEFTKSLSRGVFDSLSGALANAFTDGLDDIPAQFSRLLLDLTSKLLASKLLEMLSSFGQSQGGAIGGIIGAFAGGFATGGSFTVGGSGGVDSQLVSLAATPGERVTVETPQQQKEGQAMPQVNVEGPTIINTIEDSDIVSAFNRGGGGKTILNYVTENASSFRQAMGLG